VPRSRLEGREPTEVTEHEYDEAGRLIRSVTTREPLWTEHDLADQLALVEYRSTLCPCGCGFPVAETTSHEEAGPSFAAKQIPCRARQTLIEQQTAHLKSKGESGDPIAGARLWSISMQKR